MVQEDAYERYVAHQQANHPDEPVMTEKQFWRDRTDNSSPRMRCC